MKTLAIMLALLCCSMVALGQQKEFQWLVGTWKLKDKNAFEVWAPSADGNTLDGSSFRVKGADTVVTESIKLKAENGSFFYVPDVAGDQGPVYFKITSVSTTSFVAENPQHDFPKIIRYNFVRKNDQEMIEATIEGGAKVISYTFVRLR